MCTNVFLIKKEKTADFVGFFLYEIVYEI
jgi:hypothetical protein